MKEIPPDIQASINTALAQNQPPSEELELTLRDIPDMPLTPNEPSLEELGNQYRVTNIGRHDAMVEILDAEQIIVPTDTVQDLSRTNPFVDGSVRAQGIRLPDVVVATPKVSYRAAETNPDVLREKLVDTPLNKAGFQTYTHPPSWKDEPKQSNRPPVPQKKPGFFDRLLGR